MKQLLWLQFYPKDWNGDFNLRGCSLASRGLLASLLEPMHMAVPYGHLLVDGLRPDHARLATIASCKEREVKYGLEELIKNGVLSLTEGGIMYSRRMVRDAERRDKRSKNGKKGGNPSLEKSDPIQTGEQVTDTEVNHPLKYVVKPIETRDQRPETRDQTGECPPFAERRIEPRTTAITSGHKEHRTHACCGTVCLPSGLFDDFVRRSRQELDPDTYVRQFFRLWDARYATGDRSTEQIGEDAFDFWRKRWSESHPTAATIKPVKPATASTVGQRRIVARP